MAKRKRLKPRKRTVPVPSAVPSTSRHCPCLSTFTQGAIASCSGDGPSFRLSLPSASSMRPPQKPSVLPPILSMATFPERIMRSPQDKESPYFSFMGSRSSRALSRFPLSGQLDSGSKRIRPPSVDIYQMENVRLLCVVMDCSSWPLDRNDSPHPPRPSERRYEPAQCQARRMKNPP